MWHSNYNTISHRPKHRKYVNNMRVHTYWKPSFYTIFFNTIYLVNAFFPKFDRRDSRLHIKVSFSHLIPVSSIYYHNNNGNTNGALQQYKTRHTQSSPPKYSTSMNECILYAKYLMFHYMPNFSITKLIINITIQFYNWME